VHSCQSRLTFIASKTLSARKNIQLSKIDRFENHLPACSGRAYLQEAPLKSLRIAFHEEVDAKNDLDLVELDGIEPTTSGLQSPRSPS
jgi:hypothetical protein